jgi:DNA end-binding protein Ku
LAELIEQKREGKIIAAKPRPRGKNVVDLMDALQRSIGQAERATPAKRKKPRKATAGQKEMLLPITSKRAAKDDGKKIEKPTSAHGRNEHDWPCTNWQGSPIKWPMRCCEMTIMTRSQGCD